MDIFNYLKHTQRETHVHTLILVVVAPNTLSLEQTTRWWKTAGNALSIKETLMWYLLWFGQEIHHPVPVLVEGGALVPLQYH